MGIINAAARKILVYMIKQPYALEHLKVNEGPGAKQHNDAAAVKIRQNAAQLPHRNAWFFGDMRG
ncbi:hypothetical protein J4729_20185 [Leisingera sp. HS039]|uniref:hypothetical protein n=1 Tax=Leisingera sp. HS039 TaxID=2818496 RepID=UPI001B3A306F|nr:hypothetical protein [Leisingera sp. HS039]MBQ4826843.1 hypothetical protein [Leisingera sp. HS039]